MAGYYLMAFRTSVGDYNLDNYAKSSDFKILTWIFWFIVMIVGNVIFMNFIIAVVNQSYSDCMQEIIQSSYLVKLDLIVERESIMTNKSRTSNKLLFPSYLVMILPPNAAQNQGTGDQIKDIKTGLDSLAERVDDQMQEIKEIKLLLQQVVAKQNDVKQQPASS